MSDAAIIIFAGVGAGLFAIALAAPGFALVASHRRDRRRLAGNRIINALAGAAPHGMSSAELCKVTGLGPARAFPALAALERQGLITSEWEKPSPAFEPRRRLYWIAGGGNG
jgi:hypothetical protein